MSIKYTGPENYEVLGNILRNNDILQLNKIVEVGVRHGTTSEYLLKNFKKLKMLLVDFYAPYLDVGNYQFTKEEQDKICRDAKMRLVGYGTRATWLRMPSVEAAVEITDGSQDCVFIDATHTEKAVSEDLMAWYSKVRPGGIISGHDYSIDEVGKAVRAWSEQFGKPIIHTDINSDVWVMQI